MATDTKSASERRRKMVKRFGKKLGSSVQLWHMLERPRAWLLDSLRAGLIQQMRATLGPTPALDARQVKSRHRRVTTTAV